jgi:hypothetical protein
MKIASAFAIVECTCDISMQHFLDRCVPASLTSLLGCVALLDDRSAAVGDGASRLPEVPDRAHNVLD